MRNIPNWTSSHISCDKLTFKYKSGSSSCPGARMEIGVIEWEMMMLIGTRKKERTSASQWKAPPHTHKKSGIVQRWWLDVIRWIQLDPGLKRYLHTPIGKVPNNKNPAISRYLNQNTMAAAATTPTTKRHKVKKILGAQVENQNHEMQVIQTETLQAWYNSNKEETPVKRSLNTHHIKWSIPTAIQNACATIGRLE